MTIHFCLLSRSFHVLRYVRHPHCLHGYKCLRPLGLLTACLWNIYIHLIIPFSFCHFHFSTFFSSLLFAHGHRVHFISYFSVHFACISPASLCTAFRYLFCLCRGLSGDSLPLFLSHSFSPGNSSVLGSLLVRSSVLRLSAHTFRLLVWDYSCIFCLVGSVISGLVMGSLLKKVNSLRMPAYACQNMNIVSGGAKPPGTYGKRNINSWLDTKRARNAAEQTRHNNRTSIGAPWDTLLRGGGSVFVVFCVLDMVTH